MEMMRQSEQITQNISTDAEKGMQKMDSMKSIVSESSNDVKKLANETCQSRQHDRIYHSNCRANKSY